MWPDVNHFQVITQETTSSWMPRQPQALDQHPVSLRLLAEVMIKTWTTQSSCQPTEKHILFCQTHGCQKHDNLLILALSPFSPCSQHMLLFHYVLQSLVKEKKSMSFPCITVLHSITGGIAADRHIQNDNMEGQVGDFPIRDQKSS